MKRLFLAAFAVLALFAGPASAGSESYFATHTVVKGDTLWGVSHRYLGTGKQHAVIAKANSITNPRKLRIGTVLFIPVVPTIHIHNHNTAPLGAKAVQGSPKVLCAIDNILGANYTPEMKAALKLAVSESDPSPSILMKGEQVDCFSDKFSGQYGMYCPPNGFIYDWDKVGALRADFWSAKTDNLACLVRVIEICGNVDTWCWEIETPAPPPAEEVPAPPDTAPPESKIPPVTEVKVPEIPKLALTIPQISIVPKYSIAVHKPITCLDFELNARQGFWWGDSAHGEFSYAEGGVWDTCWGWGRMVGFYGSRDSGKVEDTTYEWHGDGIGPQFGLRYLDFYTNPDNTVGFHGYTAKLRFMYARMKGKNPESLYHMSQEDLLVGLYLEYVRHISKKTTVALTFEGWLSLWSRMETTWAGDSISNRAWLQAGGYVQQKISKNWSARTGLYGFYHVWDREPGVGAFAEARYYDTFLAGFAFNFGFENGSNYGPYVGVEAGNYARAKRDRKIEDGIWSIDESGNPLNNSEDEIWDAGAPSCETCAPVAEDLSKPVVQETATKTVTTVQDTADESLDNLAEPDILISQAERAEYDKLDQNTWPATEAKDE